MFLYYIIPVIILFLFYLYMKKRALNQLGHYLKRGDTEGLRIYTTQKTTRFFLDMYIIDLHIAKSYFLDKNMDALKNQLRNMFAKEYAKSYEIQYLTLYYHIFILKKDEPFVLELLEKIKQINDVSFVKSCIWTKQVLFDHEMTLIEEMDAAIENKEFSGFLLGVILYLMAVQYELLDDIKKAYETYQIAVDVFQPKDLYVKQVKEKLELLKLDERLKDTSEDKDN